MLPFLAQIPSAGLPGQTQPIPELPPGPSLDHLRGPIEIPFMEPWQIAAIALLIVVVISLMGWILFRYARRHNEPMPMSPKDAAVAELKSAAELTANNDEQFAVLSSMALRRYFETGKGIYALGKTTDEFLQSLNENPLLNTDSRKSLAAFMQRCDQVKFARTPLTEAERRGLTESALELIRRCEATHSETDEPNAQS